MSTPDPYLASAIGAATVALRRAGGVFIGEREALTLASEAVKAAEPLLRQHMMLDIADAVAVADPKMAAVLRHLVKQETDHGSTERTGAGS